MRRLWGAVLCVLLLFSSQVKTQTTASIFGMVKDEAGAALPAATVMVVNLDTGIKRTAVTDEEGRYRILNLPPGDYEVRASLPGFRTEIRRIRLTVGSEVAVEFTLKVGEITEHVVVTGEVPLVETSTAISGLIDEKKVRDLPLNGRTFSELALLETGVVAYTHNQEGYFGGRSPKISIAGARFNQVSFLLDGTDVNNMYNNTPGSVAGVFLGVEAIREFRVLTHNMSAEYGRTAGGIINVITRSGTNEFHGSLFEYHRNSAMDARNFFDRSKEPPPFKRNQFGFTLGGPIQRERAFFFGVYEGLRERLSLTRIGFVPSREAREGRLVPVNPVVRPLLDSYPEPNGRDLGGGVAEHIFVFNQPTREDFFQIRVDHQFSSADSFFVRYTFDDGSVARLSNPLPAFKDLERSRNQYLTLEEQHIFSSAILNTFRFGLNRSFASTQEVPFPGGKVPPTILPYTDRRFIIVGGLTNFGTDNRVPIFDALNLVEWSDDLSIIKGRHSLKFGTNIKYFQLNILQSAHGTILLFPSVVQLVQGRPAFFFGPLPDVEESFRSLRQSMFAFYGQDDIRLTPNVTLNVGLRYEFVTVPKEKHGRLVAFLGPFDPARRDLPVFKNPSLRNFAPRIGLAWDPLGDKKTSIRAGFGIFYDPIISYHFRPNLSYQFPFVRWVERVNPPFPNLLEGLDFQKLPFSFFAHEYDFMNPYMLHYSFVIQREIFPDMLVSVGYIGSRGIHLGGSIDANSAIPTILPDGRIFFPPDSRRRNPMLGGMRLKVHDNNSFYNSLVVSINRRFRGGLQAQASYTFGKSIDDASQISFSEATGQMPVRMVSEFRKLDRGLSIHDIRHNLSFNFSYDLPIGRGVGGAFRNLLYGWQINGIGNIRSGNPFTVLLQFNNSRSFNVFAGQQVADRPNIKPGRTLRNVTRPQNPDQYFDISVFELPEPGFIGNVGRNSLIGPGVVTFDLSLVKNTQLRRLSEEGNLQFRCEIFNLFNRPNFGLPQNIVFGPGGRPVGGAGRITRTTTPSRQIQFALKLMF